jgi:hypothetical protein
MSSDVFTGGIVRISKSEPGLERFEKKKSMALLSSHCPFKVNAIRAHAHAALLPGTKK